MLFARVEIDNRPVKPYIGVQRAGRPVSNTGTRRGGMMTDAVASADRQIAVLVDVENVGLDSMQWLFDQLADVGRIIVKKAYGDWSSGSGKRDQLLELGVEAIQVFHATPSGKNTSDIRLAIDAVDLLYQSPVDTFVIVSSDSDFVPLVGRLRAAGKLVIGAGGKKTSPNSLARAAAEWKPVQCDTPSLTSPSSLSSAAVLSTRSLGLR